MDGMDSEIIRFRGHEGYLSGMPSSCPRISEPLASGPDGRRGRIGYTGPGDVLLLFVYAAVRAVMVSLTYDESYTLLHHVLPGCST